MLIVLTCSCFRQCPLFKNSNNLCQLIGLPLFVHKVEILFMPSLRRFCGNKQTSPSCLNLRTFSGGIKQEMWWIYWDSGLWAKAQHSNIVFSLVCQALRSAASVICYREAASWLVSTQSKEKEKLKWNQIKCKHFSRQSCIFGWESFLLMPISLWGTKLFFFHTLLCFPLEIVFGWPGGIKDEAPGETWREMNTFLYPTSTSIATLRRRTEHNVAHGSTGQ